MLKWIIQNKDLLFGGIGIIIFIYFVKFIYWLITKNKRLEQIEKISQKYLDIVDGRIRGHSGVPGLIESGAA